MVRGCTSIIAVLVFSFLLFLHSNSYIFCSYFGVIHSKPFVMYHGLSNIPIYQWTPLAWIFYGGFSRLTLCYFPPADHTHYLSQCNHVIFVRFTEHVIPYLSGLSKYVTRDASERTYWIINKVQSLYGFRSVFKY